MAMIKSVRVVSAVAVACLAVCIGATSASSEGKPVNYEPGKLTAAQYSSVGKKAIPFKKSGQKFIEKNYKTMGIFEFWVEYNVSDVNDDAQVNNDGWFKDMTVELYKMTEGMFTEMGFTVKDKDAFTSDSSFAAVSQLSQNEFIKTTEKFRTGGALLKDGKPNKNISYEYSCLKASVPGLYYYDTRGTDYSQMTAVTGIGKSIEQQKKIKEAWKVGDQFYNAGKEATVKQNLDVLARVHITAGLNDEKKGTPETSMEISFIEKPEPPDPSRKVRIVVGTEPFVYGSGVWYIKKGDNRIGGDGKDKKEISGEKLKASMIDMFKQQCNTYSATYNMYKAKYQAKK
jgi:hypothetical protein